VPTEDPGAGTGSAEPLPVSTGSPVFHIGDFGITSSIFSCRSLGGSYEHMPMPTLITPITIIPPVTGSQYLRCFFENGRARSLRSRGGAFVVTPDV